MSIRKPRRHERLAIYKKMLRSFKEDLYYMKSSGFCRELYIINEGLKRSEEIEDYLELMAYMPVEAGTGYWWPVSSKSEGRQVRMKILRKIIKEMSK